MENDIELLSFPTYRALEDYKEQQFAMLIWVYENLTNTSTAQLMIEVFGEDGLYDQLVYHQKLLMSVSEFKSSALLNDYMQWRYRLIISRGISPEYLFYEHQLWIKALQIYLFEAFSSEFIPVYQSIVSLHEIYINATKPTMTKEDTHSLIHSIVHAMITNDEIVLNDLFQTHLYRYNSPFEFFDTVIKPSMIEIGRLWEINHITVAKEHIATAMMERLWNQYADLPSSIHLSGKIAFVILPDQQLHKLGGKMVSTLLHQKGWKVANLTLNENFRDIYDAILEFRPQLLVFSASMAIHIPLIQHCIDELKEDPHFFSGKIAVGGQAFYRTDPPIILEKTDFQSENLKALDEYITTF